MSLPPLATVADLEARLGLEPGSLTGADRTRAEADLEEDATLVRAAASKAWVAEDGTSTAPAIAKTVVLRAALRVYRNPAGHQSNQTGPFAFQIARSEIGIYLTDAEVDLIKDAAGRSGAYMVRTPSAYYD